MRLHRFYAVQPLGEEVVIDDVSLIQQWLKVFRYTEGDFVILFNGDGTESKYSISEVSRKYCRLTRTEQTISYIPHKKIVLFLSLIKKDNFELAVQKATELGVTTIIPIISERSEKKNLNESRLLKIAIEASEQCGRGDIPFISPIISLEDALHTNNCNASYMLQMGGKSILDESIQTSLKNASSVGLFIGPEGGWSPEEEELFITNRLIPVKLSETVLRAETAAIVASSLFLM